MTIETTRFTHRPRVSLARFCFCWWRHNRVVMASQWPNNCDANTWQVISNSLDIDFINGNIHGRSCKNFHFPGPLCGVSTNNNLEHKIFYSRKYTSKKFSAKHFGHHLPLDKMAAISQMMFSDAFSWMKSFVFWFKFHWNLFLRVQLTITQHWFG